MRPSLGTIFGLIGAVTGTGALLVALNVVSPFQRSFFNPNPSPLIQYRQRGARDYDWLKGTWCVKNNVISNWKIEFRTHGNSLQRRDTHDGFRELISTDGRYRQHPGQDTGYFFVKIRDYGQDAALIEFNGQTDVITRLSKNALNFGGTKVRSGKIVQANAFILDRCRGRT